MSSLPTRPEIAKIRILPFTTSWRTEHWSSLPTGDQSRSAKAKAAIWNTDRGTGGLVTALAGVIQHAEARWIACAQTEEDKTWGSGSVPFGESDEKVWMQFLAPSEEAYEGYYRVIANPLLWFLQHSMWDIFREPTIDRAVWGSWENGYVAVNMLFAEAIARQITAAPQPAMVMLQDYHLYLAPNFIRYKLRPKAGYTLAHFVHIP